MDLKELIKMKGSLRITKTNSNGEVIDKRFVPNLVVTVGKEFIASRMASATDAVMSHMAVGTDSTAAVIGNTTLGTEVGRVALTSGVASSTSVTYTATFPAGTGTGVLVEAGIFNATPAGIMLCRTTFPVVTKGAGDTVAIEWVITVQ